MNSPTPAEIRTARQSVGLSQAAAARLVHAGLRSWAHWEAGDRPMPPAVWELFRIKIGAMPGNLLNVRLE